MNHELETTWREAAVAYSKVLSQHSHGGTEENCEKLRSGWTMFRLRIEPAPPEYVSRVTA
jgi:hypothetical protein